MDRRHFVPLHARAARSVRRRRSLGIDIEHGNVGIAQLASTPPCALNCAQAISGQPRHSDNERSPVSRRGFDQPCLGPTPAPYQCTRGHACAMFQQRGPRESCPRVLGTPPPSSNSTRHSASLCPEIVVLSQLTAIAFRSSSDHQNITSRLGRFVAGLTTLPLLPGFLHDLRYPPQLQYGCLPHEPSESIALQRNHLFAI
jgi:hypothetical protein